MSQCISNFLSASWFPSSYLPSPEIQPSFNSAQFVNVAQRCESCAGSLYLFPLLEHPPPCWVRALYIVCPINREPRSRLRLAPRWVIANHPISHFVSLIPAYALCCNDHWACLALHWPVTSDLQIVLQRTNYPPGIWGSYTVHLCGMKEVPCWVVFKPGKLLARYTMLSFLSSLSLNFSFS